MSAYRKSPLHGVVWEASDLFWRGDTWRLLWRKIEFELAGQKFLVGGDFGRTAEDQGAAVGGREMHVEHLDRCELVEHSSRREARRQRLEPCTQRDVQAIGQERHEDVRLDAVLELVVDRAQVQIVLHGLEGGLDLDELDVEPPQLGRVLAGEIGAQQITAFAPPPLAQLVAIEREAEGSALGRHRDIPEGPS